MSYDVVTLNDFYTNVSDIGFRLPHQFQVQILPINDSFSGDEYTKFSKISYYAMSSSLPTRKQKYYSRRCFGLNLKLPTDTEFSDSIDLEMLYDAEGQTYELLLKWMDVHSDLGSSDGGISGTKSGGGTKKIPLSKVFLFLLDEKLQKPTELYTLEGVFLETLDNLKLNHTDTDTATFNVTLVYQYFHYEKLDTNIVAN